MSNPRVDTAARLGKLRTLMAEKELNALLVLSLPNIRYLTGFSGSSALAVVTADDCVLLTDFRYSTQIKDELSDGVRGSIVSESIWHGLWKLLNELSGVDVIAFESAHIYHTDAQRFLDPESGGVRWRWRPAVNLVESIRESKDEGEIACIREAVRIAEFALGRTIEQVKVGMSELDVAGILEYELRRAGSEGFPFETIVAAGARSALPHARASKQGIVTGDFLLIDFGAVYRGYCSDITRTFVVGSAPSGRQQEIYDIVREANGSASALVRAGMRGRDADALARDYIERLGLGDAFGHSLGHGIGLEVHEAPRLAKSAEKILLVGSVVTIEPGVYLEGWGGVRVEDNVVLTASGPEILTGFDRALQTIG